MSVQNRLLKYGIHGAATFAALRYIGGAGNVLVGNTYVPVWALGAGLGIGSSMVNDLLHSVVLPFVSPDDKLRSMESTATSLAAGAGSLLLGAMLIDPGLVDDIGRTKLAMIGAATEVFSQWAYEQSAMWFGVKVDQLVF